MRPIHVFKVAVVFFVMLLFHPRTIQAEDSKTASGAPADETWLVYVGTFTGTKSKGIYACRLNTVDGRMSPPGLAAETPNPSFLEIDARRGFLFAANEIANFEGKSAGSVSAFSVNRETGKLTLLNQRSSVGSGPCHLVLDRENKNILVANYTGGSVAMLPVQPDGRLGESTSFVQHTGKSSSVAHRSEPHAHCTTLDAAGRFAFVCDLGLDKIMRYRLDSEPGTLSPGEPPFVQLKIGAGPRHMVFHPDGRHAYVINELNSTITTFDYNSSSGNLAELQTVSTLPDGFNGTNSTAEVAVHPSGKFLFGSNRGHDSIAVFAIDSAKGTLTLVEHQSTQGKKPRHFSLDPSGKYLLAANQDSDAVVEFTIDAGTGRLKPTGQVLNIPSPVCVKFMPVSSNPQR